MKRLLSVVGARPNFMKVAPIVEELKRHPGVEHCLVHSGQHYDELLSGNFFADLGLPKPDVNLQVGSGSHAVQTAEIMRRIEPVLLDYKPEMVVVVGDVNSTVATALTAVKLGIRVAHIEAGLRSFDMTMPEEINRKLTDAISDLLFVTEQSGVENLRHEGVAAEKIFLVGNVMIDCLLRHRELAAKSPILGRLGVRQNGSGCRPYGVLTLHRPSNVDDPKTLQGILSAVSALAAELPIFFPVHPRTRKNIESFGLSRYLADAAGENRVGIVPLDPLGYLDFLSLNDRARIVLTDSGGVQEETTVLGVPCVTLRENTERPATVEHGSNQVVGVDPDRILAAARSVLREPTRPPQRPPLWDGKAAPRIVAILLEHLR
ncbi:MAG TPA: UDP-N-acetylglucosamine 2-epimerase (non-hydrolyzing) [Candidatus Dormibacteraeota bacterium]|jgi:UDP-N-acetylglucosamine 2-epimerase (non-hydrolysing)|nr:UDP-N-acetylglucosamine 2-epimerase (non-hydrolyzing) [Candidatus Dormibacteraeota bacterium]